MAHRDTFNYEWFASKVLGLDPATVWRVEAARKAGQPTGNAAIDALVSKNAASVVAANQGNMAPAHAMYGSADSPLNSGVLPGGYGNPGESLTQQYINYLTNANKTQATNPSSAPSYGSGMFR